MRYVLRLRNVSYVLRLRNERYVGLDSSHKKTRSLKKTLKRCKTGRALCGSRQPYISEQNK